MTKNLMLALLVFSLSFGCVCSKCKKGKDLKEPPPYQEIANEVGTPNNALAFDFFQLAEKPGKNLFFSPYSLSSALSMTQAGARGETANQMTKALHLDLLGADQHQAFLALQEELNLIGKSGKAELSVANALFNADKNQKRIRKDYVNLLQQYYLSDLYSLDFKDFNGTAKFINNWVKKKTKDRIDELVTPDHIKESNEGLVLVNAIHFKGNWAQEFYPSRTKEDVFWTSSKLRAPEYKRTVQMMNANGDYSVAWDAGVQILELSYSHKDLAMLFLLPDEIEGFAKQLNAENLQKWRSSLRTTDVKVQIPKFKLEYELSDIKKMLESLGMVDAFDPMLADFSGIMEPEVQELIFIYDIIHKAMVEINEEGTEAAASTAVIIGRETSAVPPSEPILFRADKPFIFMIIHKPSGSLLFVGKMNDPS